MDILQLTYFKKIAELENVSKAASELMVAQPALSKVIRTLETELDTKLFDRVGKKIYLNNNGRILLKHTNKILNHLEQLKAEIADENGSMTGNVSVSFQAATRMIPQILLEFKQKYPTIKIIIKKTDTLINENCDFLIYSSRHHIQSDKDTILLKEHCYIAMSNKHRLANQEFVDMHDLKDEDFIILQSNKSLYDLLYEFSSDSGFIPNISLECDHQTAVLALIEHNMGVALIPSKTWNISPESNVVLKPIRNKASHRYINLKERSTGYLSNSAKIFKTFLIEFFETHQDTI